MQRSEIAKMLLVLAIAYVFGIFGVDKFVHPLTWIGWIPAWMEGLLGLSKNTWLEIIGVVEIAVSVLVSIPMRRVQQVGAALGVVQLIGVLSQIVPEAGLFNDITVRDTGLLIANIALLAIL